MEISENFEQPAAETHVEPRFATFDQLVKKPRRVATVPITVPTEDGSSIQVKMKFQALSSTEYDELVEQHPPKRAEKDNGAIWNSETFPPALVAACSLEPKLSPEQARELSKHENWATGEFTSLFMAANRVTNAGLDVPFNEGG